MWSRSAFDHGGDGNVFLCGLGCRVSVALLQEEPDLCGGRWSWFVLDGSWGAAHLGQAKGAAGLCWAPLLGMLQQDTSLRRSRVWPAAGQGLEVVES